MTLSYKEVAEILKIIDASSCEEVVLELENTRLVVRRGGAASDPGTPALQAPPTAPATEAAPLKSPAGVAAKDSRPSGDDNHIVVKSPMAGTFFSRPSPGENPFVDEGGRISAGDTLCLIEVMKLYTTIEATVDGVIESVLAADASLVEFDQPLFVISRHGE
jgi:acetyl-CoA carboxylase biotin carboxyl carrier protein